VRILVVSQYFWPEEFRVNEVVEDLVKRGFDVDVLTGKPNYPKGKIFSGYSAFTKETETYQGATVYRVPLIPRGNGGGINLILNYISYAFVACVLGPFICKKAYDLIFVVQLSPVTVALPAILLKKLFGIPMILWVLDLWPESISAAGGAKIPLVNNLIGGLVKWIYANSDQILISSEGFKHSLRLRGVADQCISYFPNWSEESGQGKTPSLDNQGLLTQDVPDGFIIMFAGNIGVAQDFETIIKAMVNIRSEKEIHWVILGDGRRFTWLQDQVRRNKLAHCVHLLGRFPAQAMPAFYKKADVLLVSLRREPVFEYTVPGKIQSYMAGGKPIIASLDGEGARLIERAGAGITCNAQDAHALTESVLTMYRYSEADRNRMGAQGYEYFIKHFERNSLMSDLEEKFNNQIVA